MNQRVYDTVVVGAGPIGCYSAHGLAANGYDVLVIEKDDPPKAPPVCTGVIGVQAFHEFDLPHESILSEVKNIVLLSPSGKRITYQPPQTQAYIVDRVTFDGTLRRQAERAGASFLEGILCKDIKIADDHVEIVTSLRGKPIISKTLVLASGYHPGLVAKLGLGKISDHFEGIQTEARVADLHDTEVYVGRSVAPFSFAWMLPVGSGLARIGLTTRRNGSFFLAQFLGHPSVRDRVGEVGDVSRKLIPYGQLSRSFTTRSVVVGEAAGQVKSTTHGGIYFGLIGARCAVETLGEAFEKGEFGTALLAKYEDRWKKILGGEISRGFLLRKLFSRLTDRQVERLFDLSSKDGIMSAVREKAHFDWHSGIISALSKHPLLRRYLGE